MENTVTLPPETLTDFAATVFTKAGLPSEHAQIIADTLVSADLRGVHSHGLIRLPFLLKRLTDGGANPAPHIAIVNEAPATALVDGDRALGPITANFAMQLAIDKAATQGVGFVSVRNSDFFGTCAHPAMLALKHDMIGFVWTNGAPGMAPWGGRRNDIGNNPLGFAVPRASGGPIVLDMAMSVAAGGKVRVAIERDEDVPAGWIVDRDGHPSVNPADLIAGGALLALGHKGYGLAVIGEILAGALSGSRILTDIPQWFKATDQTVGSGHIHLAIDIARFIDVSAFKLRVDEISERLKQTPLAAGFNEILMPGEREWQLETRQRTNGIPLIKSVYDELCRVGRQLDVEFSTHTSASGSPV